MEKVLFVLFWALVIYYLFRLFFKYVVPWLIARYVKNLQRRMGEQLNRQTNQYENKSASETDDSVHVDYVPKEKPKTNSDIGEYIDFEDINESNPES